MVAMMVALTTPTLTQAQVNDSLIVLYWQSDPGDRPGFVDDLNGLGKNRFDANGDGIPEAISVDTNENGVPETMYVTSLVTNGELGLREGDVIYEFQLSALRQQLLDAGAPESAVRNLRFLRFIRWQEPTEQVPIYPLVFGGVDDEGTGAPNIWVCYPALISAAPNNMVVFNPLAYGFLAFEDFDGDGWPEAVVADNESNSVMMFSSTFAPGE